MYRVYILKPKCSIRYRVWLQTHIRYVVIECAARRRYHDKMRCVCSNLRRTLHFPFLALNSFSYVRIERNLMVSPYCLCCFSPSSNTCTRCDSNAFQPVLSQTVHRTATYMCDDTRGCIIQFWPPDDEHMCSKHVEAWKNLIVKQKFCASSWLITKINCSKWLWMDPTLLLGYISMAIYRLYYWNPTLFRLFGESEHAVISKLKWSSHLIPKD